MGRVNLIEHDFQEVRKLWNEWDPIGACPSENDILDEYDFYLKLTLQLLRQTATTVEIENYLNLVLEEFMGMRGCLKHKM